MAENIGKVIQISGPAVDVQFAEGSLPPIYQAVRVVSDGFTVPSPINVILEVQPLWPPPASPLPWSHRAPEYARRNPRLRLAHKSR